MMKISKRLKKLASLIDKDKQVVDIGCDHALLDIYLTLYNNNRCIATDINKSALKKAEENIKKYNLNIKTIISDGLSNVEINNDQIVVLAGMGTSTIISILNTDKIDDINKLVIQTNNDIYHLRKFIVSKGFNIVDEIGFIDKKIRYTQIKFERGKKNKNIDYLLGPILSKKIDLDTKEYYQSILKENKDILAKLPKKYILKRLKLKIINNKINSLKCFKQKM